MLTACSSEELANQEVAQQSAETPVAFSIYTPRTITRAGEAGELTTPLVGDPNLSGFGVFAYYSNGQKYAEANTYPNFMYNQRVYGNGDTSDPDPANWVAPTKWQYEPVKYWPNEYGNAATSDDIDRVTFFAYAPWTEVDPSTGVMATAKEDEKNIIGMTRNKAVGDPIIKYVVDTEPATSVDLLWGVAGKDYATSWGGAATANVVTGAPFIDLLKPNDPVGTSGTYNDGKIVFNLRHALAKLNVQIDYIDDMATPKPLDPTTDEGKFDPNHDATPGSEEINANETKVFIREIKIGGFSMKGALNLNNGTAPKFYTKTGMKENTTQPVPNWLALDGVNELVYEMVTFKDGRRDGKEGAADAAADGESFLGLNPCLLQLEPYTVDDEAYPTIFKNAKFDPAKPEDGGLLGVTKTAVNLFGDGTAAVTKPIFVIPNDKPIDIEIVYDVETVNPKLASKLSDGIVPGLSTENKIKKTSKEIFNTKDIVTMQAGEGYTIKIHLGMTSVKVEAEVEEWHDLPAAGIAELPANQPKP